MRKVWKKMGGILSSLTWRAHRLFDWWFAEIRELWFELRARATSSQRTSTEIELTSHGGRIFDVQGDQKVEISAFQSPREKRLPANWSAMTLSVLPPGNRLQVALPAMACLRFQFSFPAAVRREIKQVVALRLERELPVDPARLYVHWSYRAKDTTVLWVEGVAAMREDIDAITTSVRERGLDLAAVVPPHGFSEHHFNFLERHFNNDSLPTDRRTRRLIRAVVALICCFFVGVAALWIYERISVGKQLEQERQRAKEAKRLERNLGEVWTGQSFVATQEPCSA